MRQSEDRAGALREEVTRSASGVDVQGLVEIQLREVRAEAEGRVRQAEDAARTAQEALRMIMTMHQAAK